MFAYFKGQPTEYILRYTGGRVRAEGQGLSFFYFLPTNSVDVGFVFNEQSANFQSVAIQGQYTYRITDPKKAAALLNFTIHPFSRQYETQDPDKLAQRITNILQMEWRRITCRSTAERWYRSGCLRARYRW